LMSKSLTSRKCRRWLYSNGREDLVVWSAEGNYPWQALKIDKFSLVSLPHMKGLKIRIFSRNGKTLLQVHREISCRNCKLSWWKGQQDRAVRRRLRSLLDFGIALQRGLLGWCSYFPYPVAVSRCLTWGDFVCLLVGKNDVKSE
jgi:hypothetical protein